MRFLSLREPVEGPLWRMRVPLRKLAIDAPPAHGVIRSKEGYTTFDRVSFLPLLSGVLLSSPGQESFGIH